MDEDLADERLYIVIINDEEQHSLWLSGRSIPPGWRQIGIEGQRDQCLAYIEKVWTDMRPLTLRRKMSHAAPANEGDGKPGTC